MSAKSHSISPTRMSLEERFLFAPLLYNLTHTWVDVQPLSVMKDETHATNQRKIERVYSSLRQ